MSAQEDRITFKEAIQLFDFWQDVEADGHLLDCRRFEKEFIEFYSSKNGYKMCKESPLYLMFCSFLGAVDMFVDVRAIKKIFEVE